MKQTYRALAALIALGVVFQASAIAFGWFDVIAAAEEGAVFDQNSELNTGHVLHGVVGMMVMPVLGLLLLGVSFGARRAVPGAITWGLAAFLAIVLQVVLAFISFGTPVVGWLHGANALLILGLALKAVEATRRPTAAEVPAAPSTAGSPASGTSTPV